MSKRFPDRNLDDQLAQFTEDLAGEGGDKNLLVANDPELAKYQKTVLRLQRALGQAEPGAQTAAEMRRELIAEWYRAGMHQGAGRPAAPFFTRLRKQLSFFGVGRHPRLAFVFTAAAVALLLTVLVLSPLSGGDGLSAVALGENFLPITLAVFLILGGVLFWSLRNRR